MVWKKFSRKDVECPDIFCVLEFLWFGFIFLGENGQIPPFCKICSKKALFWNLLVIYHFSGELFKLEFQMVLDYSKLEFPEVLPPWHHLTWHLGIKKCQLVLGFLGLEYCASLVPESIKLEYQFACEAPIS